MSYRTNVLDHGFVELRNLAGPTRRTYIGPPGLQGNDLMEALLDGPRPFDADDCDPANAARISFGNLDSDVVTLRDGTTRPRTRQDDYNLNRYLLANEHASPFEMIQVWFEWKVPIFVDRQFVRHGTIRRNEESARYTQLPAEWYIPEVVGGKAKDKKQGQADNLSSDTQAWFQRELNVCCRDSYELYKASLDSGVAAEHARMFLHVNHYVHYITTVNLRNLMHFLRLRTHEHAQIEARKYAEAIVELVRPHLPQLMGLFDELVRIPPAFTQADAVELAKMFAASHASAHGYLANASDPDWLPHDWVVEAILAVAAKRR